MHCSEKGFINAVSADEASVISVWNAETGELVIQFVARMRVLPDGTELPVAVTAMRFDGSLRRLVTGFNDGCVRTFNCNNGAILREVYSCLHCSYIELHPPVCLSVCLSVPYRLARADRKSYKVRTWRVGWLSCSYEIKGSKPEAKVTRLFKL